MKRRNQWIALAVTGALLLALLYGCQASNTPLNVPGSTEVPVTERTADTTAATEAAATELPEIIMEATQATDNTESAQATEAPTEATTETTDATTEPEAPSSPKPADSKPTEPKAAEPKPTTPKPTEPKPTTPTSTQPKPTEPKPITPTPTQPKPTEPKPTNPPHSHSWSAWTQTTAPTCSAAGEETRRCSCGAKESRSVAATGNHSWSETAPTCTATGVKTCKTCGKTESTAALGHDWVHHDEEGWWQEEVTCWCGAKFYDTYGVPGSAYAAYEKHWNSLDREERDNNHGGYQVWDNWVVINAAYDVCSRCGATRP